MPPLWQSRSLHSTKFWWSNILISCGFNEKSATWDSLTTFILQALMLISVFFLFSDQFFFTIHYLYSCLLVTHMCLRCESLNRLKHTECVCLLTLLLKSLSSLKFCFWKKSHRLTKAAFIWSKTDKKTDKTKISLQFKITFLFEYI